MFGLSDAGVVGGTGRGREMKLEYDIIRAEFAFALVGLVNERIAEGWLPDEHGFKIDNGVFYQVMTRQLGDAVDNAVEKIRNMEWTLHADTQTLNRYREILAAFEQSESPISKYMRLQMEDYLAGEDRLVEEDNQCKG